MSLLGIALKKPISVIVVVLALVFFGVRATKEIKVDVLPEMDLPVVHRWKAISRRCTST